jgi:hypothetical protein
MFMVYMILINGNSMQQMIQIYVKVDLDEHCSDLVISGNIRCAISNPKSLIDTMTHQGA